MARRCSCSSGSSVRALARASTTAGLGPGLFPPLEAGVVVDTYPGEGGDFLAAQPRGAADARALDEADVGRGDLGAPGVQEVSQLGAAALSPDPEKRSLTMTTTPGEAAGRVAVITGASSSIGGAGAPPVSYRQMPLRSGLAGGHNP